MKNYVTVVPPNFISVDREPQQINIPIPINFKALQWHNGKGHIEYHGQPLNKEISGEQDYTEIVLPFVQLFEQYRKTIEEKYMETAAIAAKIIVKGRRR